MSDYSKHIFKSNNSDNSKNLGRLLDLYIIVKPIGKGSFGEVYLTQERSSGGYVAVKTEKKSKCSKLKNEYQIYTYLRNNNFTRGLPKVYDYFDDGSYNVLVMQLLGPSLEDLFNRYNRIFTLSTVFMIADQLILLLKNLHQANFIHRDIKPNNFLIGRGEDMAQIYIMDFGLSKIYKKSDQHISFRDNKNLIGTARYASINMHMGIEPSRRDELESVGYMLVYFLIGKLPWQGLKKNNDIRHIDTIGEVKMCTKLDDLCNGLPSCFREYLSYCRKLRFDETPDYHYLRGLFLKASLQLNINPKYQWCE